MPAAIAPGKHVVMVNVEADALAGPLLGRKAREAGVVYSLAWGDQPALICEHVDWARACGFKVVAAGKGTRYHPTYHRSTPDTVWEILDQYLKIEDRSHINPKMFNSFIDGTKSGIEMTAVCNATGLVPQSQAWASRPPRASSWPTYASPGRRRHAREEGRHRGRLLAQPRRQGRAPSPGHGHLRGRRERQPLRRPVLRRVQLPARQERAIRRALSPHPHDRARARHLGRLGRAEEGADGGADLLQLRRGRHRQAPPEKGEVLDGEGGFSVWGRQTPADVSLQEGYLPLGLAHGIPLTRDIPEGQPLRWSDVAFDAAADAVKSAARWRRCSPGRIASWSELIGAPTASRRRAGDDRRQSADELLARNGGSDDDCIGARNDRSLHNGQCGGSSHV